MTAIETANNFFLDLSTKHMNAAEAALYKLKLERTAILRDANAYALALNKIDQYRDECRARLEARHGGHDLHGRQYRDKVNKQVAAYQREMSGLNADYPLGYARKELNEINASIAQATVELHRSRARNLKEGEHCDNRRRANHLTEGEHWDSRRTNLGNR